MNRRKFILRVSKALVVLPLFLNSLRKLPKIYRSLAGIAQLVGEMT